MTRPVQPDSSETVWKGDLIGVTVERWGDRTREIVEHPGAVTIVAVDSEGYVAFVRQLREATHMRLLELPAGTREPDEEPLSTAQRELREECGMTGGTWTPLGGFWTAPGFTREYMHVFLAEGVDAGEAAPEPDEDLELVLIHRDDIPGRLGEVEDAKTLAGLYLYFGR
ncbi:MAG: NUDIX hydrolase [Gaiellaceae bacterium]